MTKIGFSFLVTGAVVLVLVVGAGVFLAPQIKDAGNAGAILGERARVYTDPVYGFSFSYPRYLRAYPWADGTAHMVSALDLSGSPDFEIRIKPYQEDGILTAEFIRESFADSLRSEPKEVVFGSGIRAFEFLGTDPDFGEALNTVFVHPDRASGVDDLADLYHIRSAKHHAEQLGAMLGTWRYGD